ncbi:MAG: FAD-dependent oxidoreductase, partial [Bdellovibrionota bacterium]
LWSCAHKALVAPVPSIPDPAVGMAFTGISPVDRNYVRPANLYSGDNPDRAHAILWDKTEYLVKAGGIPAVDETAPLVIVGGGMSGLISAYLLRDLKPIVLERAERFGGNARGESWQGIDYSIGAAYFMSADPGTPLDKLYKEVGINEIAKVKRESDPVLYRNKVITDFASGVTDPAADSHFAKFKKLFHDYGLSQNGRVYPAIPPSSPEEKKSILELDRYNFLEFIEKELGASLHPHLRTLLEDYCWSSMGSSMRETSAALGVCFFGGEFADVLVTPGGNSGVAERFLTHLHKEIPDNLRPSCVVVDITVKGNDSFVTYEDANGKLRRIKAGAVIMACPKFVAKKLITGLEPARLKAIESLTYQPYLVANALLNCPVKHTHYDTFLLGEGDLGSEDIRVASSARGATDVVNANFANNAQDHTVLTLYRALPFPGARAEIFSPESYTRFEQEFRVQLEKEVLPGLGYEPKDLAELRLARWGHPLPIAKPGVFRGKALELCRKPFAKRVFFVQQDNWATPALETCAREAIRTAPNVRALLKKSQKA